MIRKSVQQFSEKDHAQSRIQSAMTIHPDLVALWDPPVCQRKRERQWSGFDVRYQPRAFFIFTRSRHAGW
jgi:hypothetical protein